MSGTWAGTVLIGAGCLLTMSSAAGYQFDWGDLEISLNNRATVGATWRTEKRDAALVSKLNNNPGLCPDDCLDLGGANGDPGPNQRLVDAPGSFFGANGDNGNLNFDQGDMTAAQLRLATDLTAFWGDVVFQFSSLAFYDGVASHLDEFHPDNFEDVPPVTYDGVEAALADDAPTAFQPRRTRLSDDSIDQIGHDIDVFEAFVSVPFDAFGRRVSLSVGEQRVHWGESLFNFLGSLDQLNPVDQNRLFFPGTEIASVFEPTGLAVLDVQMSQNVGLQLVYQYDWERSTPAADGSLFNILEAAGGGDTINISLGQLSEDPDQTGGFTNFLARQATATTGTGRLLQGAGRPESGGQYGARLNWYLPDFNGGTELSFYALNYHARLPVASIVAADESCARRAGEIPAPGSGDIPGLDVLTAQLEQAVIENVPQDLVSGITFQDVSADAIAVAIACGGFNGQGRLADALQATFGPLSPNGPDEAAPIDTIRPFLDYPEDIHMVGLSFNTNLGKWAMAGEYAFRPNQPLAIQASDVVFAGLQPAFAEEDVNIGVGVLPSARNAVPDLLSVYRNDPVEPNEMIRGYERLRVQTADITGLRVFGPNNPLGANQIILVLELGVTHVMNMPSPDDLALAALDFANGTHPSPGADGTGQPGGQPDPRSFNPTQQTGNFPTDVSAGYRILARLQYNDLIGGVTVRLIVAFLHDIHGITPAPIQNYIEGRKRILAGAEVDFTSRISGQMIYQAFWDGKFNNLADRDHVNLSVSYNF